MFFFNVFDAYMLIITISKIFINILRYNNFRYFYQILNWSVLSSSEQNKVLIYKRGDFVYYHWGCTSIYLPLSYPLKPLGKFNVQISNRKKNYFIMLSIDNCIFMGYIINDNYNKNNKIFQA